MALQFMDKKNLFKKIERGFCIGFGSALIGVRYDFILGLAVLLLTWAICISISIKKD